jgi:hypothetical protein
MYSLTLFFSEPPILKFRALLLSLFTVACVWGEPVALPPETILDHYCAASQLQAQTTRGASMDVDIEATLPKLKKEGKLHALRRISELGRITYEALRFDGDGTIKNQVITRYLSAEAEAQKDQSPSIAVTPENYKFKYKGMAQLDGRDVHWFQVTPRKKRQGLFKGDIWIDAATFLRVQESGSLVKNPSIFLKRVEFVRKYEIRDGLSVLRQVQSTISTRLVGKAELTIAYSNFTVENAAQAVAGAAGGQ